MEQILVRSDSLEDKQYLAFPISLRISDSEILVSFKRGYRHARDNESVWQVIRFNPITTEVSPPATITERRGVIYENGEWIMLEDGTIDLFLDVQIPGSSQRDGLITYRSFDSGHSFQHRGKLGRIDGIEYGYCFQGLVDGPVILLLVMTFEYLSGGKRAVHVVGSDDGGKSWNRVRDLTLEFGGLPINETNMIRHDGGFVVVSRGYDGMARIHKMDTNFKLIRQINLTEENDFMKQYVSRPRIFERDGGHYLMGRNYTKTHASSLSEWPMELCFYRIDPDSFEILSYSVLDNAERRRVTDGYYATPYWQVRDGVVFFNAITYRGMGCHQPANNDFPVDPCKPDIVRLEYLWDEIR
ncbi:MAG: hypothetical protein DRP71_08380 [Verrucomicrobia bacterium]|nr:MAG: hypothetical protein DRP71_08380 [Verrucomicrobiota bacterium]